MGNPLCGDCWHPPRLPLETEEEEVERVSQEKAVGDQGETSQGLQKILKKEEIKGAPDTHDHWGRVWGHESREKPRRLPQQHCSGTVKTLPSKAGDMGLTPGHEIKIPHACGQKKGRGSLREKDELESDR